MMACLGPVVFNIVNDLQSIDIETASSFAKHDIMGAGPVYEDTGDEESTLTLKGTLHPYFVEGALQGISALEIARQSKVPVPMMRGDFTPMGWFVIKSITTGHTDLDAFDGVGNQVTYTVKLLRTDTPGGSFATAIMGLFR